MTLQERLERAAPAPERPAPPKPAWIRRMEEDRETARRLTGHDRVATKVLTAGG